MIPIMTDKLGETVVPNSSLDSQSHLSFEVREVIYRFLASLFLYPTPERLHNLKAAAVELRTAELWLDLSFAPAFARLFDALSTIEELPINNIVNEYNHLFLVKPLAPPHETFYLDRSGQFRGWMAAELIGIYSEYGLSISPALNEMPDYLAVELEFMSHLCSLAAADNSATSQAAIAGRRAFLDQHFAKWFPKFARRVKDAEPRYLYGTVVEATFLFLRSELASLSHGSS